MLKRTNAALLTSIATAACSSSPSATTMPSPPPPMADAGPVEHGPSHGHSDHHHDEHDAQPDAPPEAPPATDPVQFRATLLAAETIAFAAAKPVFDRNCASCHVQGGKKATKKKLDHFDMTSYPFGGHHAIEIASSIRTSLGIDGSKPTMPANKPGTVQGADLALIVAWADAFDAAHAGGAHGAAGGPHGAGHPH